MGHYSYLLTLVMCTFIIIAKGHASEKWSWGRDNISTEEDYPTSSEEQVVSRSIGGDFDKTAVISGANNVRPPAASEGRTLRKFFKNLECRLGMCKDKQKYSAGVPVPLYSAPVSVPIGGPYPAYSSPIAVAPGPRPPYSPYPIHGISPISGPISKPLLVNPSPVPSNIGYPPKPTLITEHHHTHTHIHKGRPISPIAPIVESPYKHTGYPPIAGFAPTVLSGGSHLDSDESFGRPVEFESSFKGSQTSGYGSIISPVIGPSLPIEPIAALPSGYGSTPIDGYGSNTFTSHISQLGSHSKPIKPVKFLPSDHDTTVSHISGNKNLKPVKTNTFPSKFGESISTVPVYVSPSPSYSSNYGSGPSSGIETGSYISPIASYSSGYGSSGEKFSGHGPYSKPKPVASYSSAYGSSIIPQKGHTSNYKPVGSHGHSHIKGTSPFSGNNNGFGISPIAVKPEAVTSTLYRPSKSLYTEECQCVLPQYCQSYDIVRKTSGKDIAHLVNPRNEGVSILSNDTDYHTSSRGKRDAPLITNRQPVAATHPSKGRALGGYSPGITGCGHNYVCCRSSSQQPKQLEGVCGKSLKSSIHGRIANTNYNKGATQFGEFPWQGAILKEKDYESIFVCGATLVSQQHVLTAAHCVVDEPYHLLRVRLGDWDVNSQTEFYKHIELPAQSVEIHPKFYAGNLENDIAVVTIKGYIDFLANPHISPICLPNAYTDFTHQHCYVTGWGKDAFGYSGEFQQILKKVDVPVVDRQSCQYALQEARLGRDYYLPEGFICAGGEEGKDTCKGDGGGPLACPTKYNSFELAGIVSWGIGCGLKGVPGVYVNIPYYTDWIRSIVDNYS